LKEEVGASSFSISDFQFFSFFSAGLGDGDSGAGRADLGMAARPIAAGTPGSGDFPPDEIAEGNGNGEEDEKGVYEWRHLNENPKSKIQNPKRKTDKARYLL
jgi:hypothetical protein